MATTLCLLVSLMPLCVILASPRDVQAVGDNKGYHIRRIKFKDGQALSNHVTEDKPRREYGGSSVYGDRNKVNSDRKKRKRTKKNKKTRPVTSFKLYQWGSWGLPSGCSRPCGVGIKYKKRDCYKSSDQVTFKTSSHLCRGRDRVYMLCNKRACKGKAKDTFQDEQCAAYNKTPYKGALYQWKSAHFSSYISVETATQCKLVCTTTTGNSQVITAKLAGEVIDGTPCSSPAAANAAVSVPGVCISGKCLAIGCNRRLGSQKVSDYCGVCDGKNTSCKIQNGTIQEKALDRGYTTLLTLPARSRHIDIVKEDQSTASLALRTKQGRHVFNTKTAVGYPSITKNIAGAEFHHYHPLYDNSDSKERLWAEGPTNRTIYIMVLSPLPNASLVITYSYSIPKRTRAKRRRHRHRNRKTKPGSKPAPTGADTTKSSSTSIPVSHYFDMDHGTVTPTKEGISKTQPSYNTSQSANQTLEGNNELGRYDKKQDKTAPFIKFSGRAEDPEVIFVPPEGNLGDVVDKGYTVYDRNTHSYSVHAGETASSTVAPVTPEISDQENRDSPIREEQNVTDDKKYHWKTNMAACSKTCSPDGVQFAFTRCYDDKDNDVDPSLCDVNGKPKVTSANCKRKTPCAPRWVASRWNRCSVDCGQGYQYRTVRCWRILSPGVDSSIHNDLCEHLKKPVMVKKCRNIACDVKPEWTLSQWNQCSSSCGQGVQTRSVVCNAGVNRCSLKEKPASTKPCFLTSCDKRMQWVVSKWSQCTERCGVQHRRVGCRSNNGSYINESHCDVTDKPLSSQLCATSDCPITWVPQVWGKCSASCGEGTTVRSVVCGHLSNSVFEELDDAECVHLVKPHVAASCRGRSCPGQYTGNWYTGEWSQCSYSCGVGSRSRLVNCYQDNRPSDQCDVQAKPGSIEQCRLPPCSTPPVRTASAALVRVCRDDPRVSSCSLVVQHGLCQHYYYRRACCRSCEGQP